MRRSSLDREHELERARGELTSELDFSVVAAPYGVGERPLGTLGIVGPSRMDYEMIIPLVNFLRDTLSRALAETFSGSYE